MRRALTLGLLSTLAATYCLYSTYADPLEWDGWRPERSYKATEKWGKTLDAALKPRGTSLSLGEL